MALNVKEKKTTLGEDASIYVKRDESKKDRDRWAELTKEEKRKQFKEYYLRPLIIGVIVVFAAAYFIIDAITSYRDQELMVAVINDYMEPEVTEALEAELMDVLGLNPKKEKVVVSSDFVLNGTGADAMTLQRLTAYIYSGTLDVVIADFDTYQTYLLNGTFSNLKGCLSEEWLQKYDYALYYPGADLDPLKIEDSNKPNYIEVPKDEPFGIKLTDSVKYKGFNMHQTNPVLGIVSNSKKKENAIQFIKYLFPD